MQHVQGLLFALILIVGYMIFFQHQSDPAHPKLPPAPAQVKSASQADVYKASLDRAQAAAKQMETAHREADSL